MLICGEAETEQMGEKANLMNSSALHQFITYINTVNFPRLIYTQNTTQYIVINYFYISQHENFSSSSSFVVFFFFLIFFCDCFRFVYQLSVFLNPHAVVACIWLTIRMDDTNSLQPTNYTILSHRHINAVTKWTTDRPTDWVTSYASEHWI